jgi:hypothetical protein
MFGVWEFFSVFKPLAFMTESLQLRFTFLLTNSNFFLESWFNDSISFHCGNSNIEHPEEDKDG